jgi:hypothetical protein
MRSGAFDLQEVSVLMLDAIDVESSTDDETQPDDVAFAETFADTLIE